MTNRVEQSGNVTPGHLVSWVTDGVVSDNSVAATIFSGIPTQRSVTTAPVQILSSDQVLNVNIAAPVSIDLPISTTRSGASITINDTGGNAVADNITISASGGETIDGYASFALASAFQSVVLIPYNDGVNVGWYTSQPALTPLKQGITSDLYIYVDNTRPNDSGDGLTLATAKKTVQAGVTLAGRYGVIVQGNGNPISAGPFIYVVLQSGQTYNEGVVFGRIDGAYAESSAYVIGSQILVANGGAGPQAANISLTGAPIVNGGGSSICFYTEGQNWAIRGLKLQNSTGDCVFSDNMGFINVWEVEWGAASGYHMIAQAGGRIVHYRDQIISGSAKGHRAVKQGGIIQAPGGQTETFSVASLAFTDAFEVGEGWGGIWYAGTITYAGNSASVVAVKYRLDGTCVLDTRSSIGTAGGQVPPGNTAGALANNAVYK